jgi:nucleoside-diphosphate-sugar epimerase
LNANDIPLRRSLLVTGAAGYLGAVFCEQALQAGYHIVGVDNLLYNQTSLLHLCSHPNFDFVQGDIRDKQLMCSLLRRADAIVNFAGVVGAPACERDPWLAREVNFEAVKQLNRLRSPQQLFLQPTSNSGYGTKSGETFCTEETPLEPISLYGRTKVEAESELLASSNAISLRLATVFGPSPRMRLDLLVNHFVYTAVTDRYLVLFEAGFKRNYVHIRDVADGFLFCLEHADRMVGQAYNLGLDSANLSKYELALKVKEFVPEFHIVCSEIGSDPDKRNYIVSSEKLRRMGFEATRSLDEGIQELLKAYALLGRRPFRNI